MNAIPMRTMLSLGNLDFGARYPVYQFLSAQGFFDNTLGIAMEVGIPTGSAISLNTELKTKLFDDLKLGEQFSLQSVLGYSTSWAVAIMAVCKLLNMALRSPMPCRIANCPCPA